MENKKNDFKAKEKELFAIANSQGGYFTAKQAASLGYKRPNLSYHISMGNFEKAGHGLFRITTIPVNEHDDLIKVYLWSRNREDKPQGVFSHVTALTLHNLSEIIPSKIFMTVPHFFQKKKPDNCHIFRTSLAPSDIQDFGEFKITKPVKTIIDIAMKKTASREQIIKSVEQGIALGIIIKSDLLNRVQKHQSLAWLKRHLKHMEQN